MNRNECDIARDLMPLSVDGVCSEGSQRFLDGHVAQCQPCRDYFNGMKAGNLMNMQVEPVQEAQALKQGLRYLGKRFKALWITLIALVSAFVLLLVAAGVQQMLLNYSTSAPLDMYTVSIYSNDALVSTGLSANFLQQVYNGFQRIEDRALLPGTNEEAAILTYKVQWFPHRHIEPITVINDATPTDLVPFKSTNVRADGGFESVMNPSWNPDYRYTALLDTHQLCINNGKLYMIGEQTAIQTTTGRTLLLIKPGLPVSEIRISDGKSTRTIYTWGDEIPNKSVDLLDEHGLPRSGFLSPSDLDKYSDLILK